MGSLKPAPALATLAALSFMLAAVIYLTVVPAPWWQPAALALAAAGMTAVAVWQATTGRKQAP